MTAQSIPAFHPLFPAIPTEEFVGEPPEGYSDRRTFRRWDYAYILAPFHVVVVNEYRQGDGPTLYGYEHLTCNFDDGGSWRYGPDQETPQAALAVGIAALTDSLRLTEEDYLKSAKAIAP
jgi:hypothetical protein